MKIHLEQFKANNKFNEKKKSGFVDSRFVKTCDELVIDLKHRLGLCNPNQPLLWIPENCKPLANYHQRNLLKIMLNWKKD